MQISGYLRLGNAHRVGQCGQALRESSQQASMSGKLTFLLRTVPAFVTIAVSSSLPALLFSCAKKEPDV